MGEAEESCGLPDPDDEHVVAAAEFGAAGVIVAENLRDLPLEPLPPTISLQTPAKFAHSAAAINLAAAVRAVEQTSQRSTSPPKSEEAILDLLIQRYGFTDAVRLIRNP